MNFCCIFPNLKNFDLFKEVGQIPYFLSKEEDYNSTIVSFDNDEFTNLNKLDGLKLEIISKKFSTTILNNLLIVRYIINNAKKIDILNCYHFTNQTLLFFLVYKIFNRKGIVYHTMDFEYEDSLKITGNAEGINNLLATQKLKFIYKYLIDYGTIETKKVLDVFLESDDMYKEKLGYMPIFIESNPSIEKNKINQIISVGRIGSYQKASEIVLKAFENAIKKINNDDWVLKMVGPISDDFKKYIEKFFNENPNLRNKIIFTGNVENRDELYEIYAESKIFLLPSRHGSFEIVFCEALFYGNFLLVSDVGIGEYIVNISKFGHVVNRDDINDISNKLIDAIENYEKYNKNNNINFKELVKDEFGHESHIKNLNQVFKSIKNNK